MEKVSVIVPVYNASDYVSECMESLLRQSYQNIEILLIDDHSSDNSLQILNGFANSKNIKVFWNEKNLGLGPTRNVGLRAATGSFICFVDADDWVEEGYIEGLVSAIKKTGADLVVTSYRSQHGQQFKTKKISSRLIKGTDIYPVAILNPYRNAMPSVCTKIYRKDIFDRGHVFFSSVRTGQDFEFNLKYMFECQCVAFVPLDSYYYYRKDIPGSITVSFRFDYIDGYRHLISVVLSYGREVADLSLLRQFRAYELYTSCRRKILQSSLSSQDRSRALSDLQRHLRPLVCSGFEALLILLFRQRFGIDYCLRKLRSVFIRNTLLEIKSILRWYL
jgi:glycosyltransferase involved in cell wall biosynthesis